MLCDTLILVIGIVLTRFVYRFVFKSFSLVKFIGLACAIQIVHDILFYIFFQSVPRMVMAVLFFALLAQQSLNTNIIVLIVALYTMPYFIFYH